MRKAFVAVAAFLVSAILMISLAWPPFYWAYLFVGPVILLGIYDLYQPKHSIVRNYPVVVGCGILWKTCGLKYINIL